MAKPRGKVLVYVVAVGLGVLLPAIMIGARHGRPGEAAGDGDGVEGGGEGNVPPYPAALPEESSPEDVVEVLLAALDGKDEDTLRGLVAVQAEGGAVGEIYRKHGRRSSHSAAEVASMVAAGWQLTYMFFEPGQSMVERVEIEGERGTVTVSGLRGGNVAYLEVKLVREDGLWKVGAGLESAGR
jgi:hypothetical protein